MRFVLFLISTLAIAGEFTTSLGDTYPYMISAITTDSAGNTYVVGSRAIGGSYSSSVIYDPLPSAPGAILPVIGILPFPSFTFLSGGSDVFVSKLDPSGKLLFTDTFAGKGNDIGMAIALDPSGNIYIAGSTTSPDFPLSKALQTQPNSTFGNGFIVKLSNDGTTILYSTYLGGTLGGTSISALATDAKGNLYLTGSTSAPDYPHTAGLPAGNVIATSTQQRYGAILTSISAAGDKILYSGVLSGGMAPGCPSGFCLNSIATAGAAVAVDSNGSAYFGGSSDTVGLPATPGVLQPNGAGGFVAKVNATGTGFSYLTYIGSSASYTSNVLALAVDAAGDAYIGGQTNDPQLATPGAFQTVIGSVKAPSGGFLAKLKPDGSAFVFSTYLGAPGTIVHSIAADPAGNVWASGTASSGTFPNAQGWSTGTDFLVGFNAAGSQTTYSQLYPAGTVGQAVALDPSGLVHTAGMSGFVFASAPATAPTMKIFDLQNAAGGNVTARIAPGELIAIYGPGIGPATAASVAPVNGFYPKTFGGVQVTLNGTNLPLLYVSANQINAVVPIHFPTGAAATLRVTNGNTASPDYPVWMLPYAPQSFPAVVNQDGTVNSATNPAKSGSTFYFYATGWQSIFGSLPDGQIASTTQDICLGNCQVSPLSNASARVTYGGTAPGIVAGVSQFNVRLGTIPASYHTFQFNFQINGPASVSQSVWVAP